MLHWVGIGLMDVLWVRCSCATCSRQQKSQNRVVGPRARRRLQQNRLRVLRPSLRRGPSRLLVPRSPRRGPSPRGGRRPSLRRRRRGGHGPNRLLVPRPRPRHRLGCKCFTYLPVVSRVLFLAHCGSLVQTRDLLWFDPPLFKISHRSWSGIVHILACVLARVLEIGSFSPKLSLVFGVTMPCLYRDFAVLLS
jgi:hypothetical protein